MNHLAAAAEGIRRCHKIHAIADLVGKFLHNRNCWGKIVRHINKPNENTAGEEMVGSMVETSAYAGIQFE